MTFLHVLLNWHASILQASHLFLQHAVQDGRQDCKTRLEV